MKIIKPAATPMPHDCSPQQFIEKIGRVTYKTEDKITDDSAAKFVDRLIKSKHWAMLEHEIAYLILNKDVMNFFWNTLRLYNISTEFLDVTNLPARDYIVLSGSIRAFHDIFQAYQPHLHIKEINYVLTMVKTFHPWAFEDIEESRYDTSDVADHGHIFTRDEFIDFCNDDKEYGSKILFRHLNHTVKFTVDRGTTHEFCRHRRVAYAMESTRYVNYSKGKYGSEITVIEPLFFTPGSPDYEVWKNSCEQAERAYMLLIQNRTPQEARTVLPNSTKADLIMTATEEEWQHFINLRAIGTTGAPHPQAREAASLWAEQLAEITNGRVTGERT